ncbi:amino acid dehydrogenase [Mycolicibacterium chubuense]|uniref:D-amino acid dehydrogenase small subunit n=1 Tax=Mycolicibacterium chubuense TaxID=1800 RepID=A0A0J6VWX1_MYCCU|nr:FAD-dependent oxidoreductase [Mycolicibacterium chubuense]KMO73917.1 D-amino acid dehydrogenase small subunit [Mycolicibacterium chubuense]ORA48258.1 amino acid dehydrogenase [Mycolicibacterium chubuense]SPX97718.1 glycine/D-amino acid oxidase, deaminating [Mycolicibacterium chubuense]
MSGRSGMDGGPRSVVVVGAGIVGLSTAWFLQDRGVDVTVVDRTGVAAGASWGNAGWVSPALTAPLNSPSVLREGLRAMADPAAALHIPLRADPVLARFLVRFAANCRPGVWQRAARANAVLNDEALETFDVLVANGVDAPVTDTSIAVAFRDADRAVAFRRELDRIQGVHKPTVEVLAGAALRTHVPIASAQIASVVAVSGQRFVDPGRFTHALARAVVERGATIRTGDVERVLPVPGGVRVEVRAGEPLHADAAVVATGAWLTSLWGRRIRVGLHAGRGYSFSVPVDRPLPGPIYLPEARVACTPYRTGLRVAGTMEFRRPEEPLFRRRIEAIVASAAPLLDGVRWQERHAEWVGSRPVTDDGMPLIGQVDRGLYVAGGHGMWGLAHGPATGRLLAEQIVTGKQTEAARAFDPLRRR